jgi:hypothetical protein
MRVAWLAVLLGLFASGCGDSSPRGAPSATASEAAARRFALDLYPGVPVLSVTCGVANDNRSRDCDVLYADGCEIYAARYDSHHRIRVVPAVGRTCLIGSGPSGSIRIE